jgi:hypothetical protein
MCSASASSESMDSAALQPIADRQAITDLIYRKRPVNTGLSAAYPLISSV